MARYEAVNGRIQVQGFSNARPGLVQTSHSRVSNAVRFLNFINEENPDRLIDAFAEYLGTLPVLRDADFANSYRSPKRRPALPDRRLSP